MSNKIEITPVILNKITIKPLCIDVKTGYWEDENGTIQTDENNEPLEIV